jgi:hypothetical protein
VPALTAVQQYRSTDSSTGGRKMKALKPPAHDQDNYFFDVLSNCSRHLGLRGLARVAASSKQLGHSCTTIITRDTLQLALAEVEAAQQFAVHLQESKADFISGAQDVAWPSEEAEELYAAQVQHLQDLVRLLQLKPAVAEAAQVIDSLLHVSMVPDHVAVQLVAAGVRITYVQLLGAANSMVEDVEVWVQAQEQLGITTDIPPAAVAVRMNNHKFPDDWVSTTCSRSMHDAGCMMFFTVDSELCPATLVLLAAEQPA